MAEPTITVDGAEDPAAYLDPLEREISRRAAGGRLSRSHNSARGGLKALFAAWRAQRAASGAADDEHAGGPGSSAASAQLRYQGRGIKFVGTKTRNKKVHEFSNLFLAQTLRLPLAPAGVGVLGSGFGLGDDAASTRGSLAGLTLSIPGFASAPGSVPSSPGGRSAIPPPSSPGAPVSDRPVWAMEFSPDGMYLAAGGADGVVWIWTLLTRMHDEDHPEVFLLDGGNARGGSRNAVFAPDPVRVFCGHSADVVSVAWSRDGFLASASLDGTVRLWHAERDGCLGVFEHPDVVTGVAFHPADGRFFLTGALDGTLRLWSIPDHEVAYAADTRAMVTAVTFTPGGERALAGTYDGHVLTFVTRGLVFAHSLQVSHRESGVVKVSGLRAFDVPDIGAPPGHGVGSLGSSGPAAAAPPAAASPGGAVRTKLLVTANESRVRVYDLDSSFLETKYKGARSNHSQVVATTSPDYSRILCPSEDGRVYIWNSLALEPVSSLLGTKDNFESESFRAGNSACTGALFAPDATKKLLFAYFDPVYRDAAHGSGLQPSVRAPPIERLDIIVTSTSKGHVRVYRQAPGLPSAPGSTRSLSPSLSNRSSWLSHHE